MCPAGCGLEPSWSKEGRVAAAAAAAGAAPVHHWCGGGVWCPVCW